MNDQSFVEDESKLINKKLHFQRWFYSIIGLIIISIIILLTFEQIRNMKKDNHEFAIYILFIVHSIYVLISILTTAIFCRITNAVLTTLTIVLLSVYTGIHFYIRFVLLHNRRNDDFYTMTIRLCFVLVLFILLLPWTNIMVHKYRMNNLSGKERIYPKSTTFSWFLYLDFMLITSLLILKIRSQSDFYSHQILFFSIGISLTLLWLCSGILIANIKTYHCIISSIFYVLSLIQIIHLGYMTYQTISEYYILSKINESTLFPLLILIIICNGTNILIHILTIVISLSLIDIQINFE